MAPFKYSLQNKRMPPINIYQRILSKSLQKPPQKIHNNSSLKIRNYHLKNLQKLKKNPRTTSLEIPFEKLL